MNILFLCLGSYKVQDTTGSDPDCFDRQLLYAISLSRLQQLAVGKNVRILVCDNTVASLSELHKPLKDALYPIGEQNILLSQDNGLGAKNKGAGEYGMCRFALDRRSDAFHSADWVVYYTHRHPMPFPFVFEYIERYGVYDALVSNAVYLYPNGHTSVPTIGMYDDLMFAMKTPTFKKYLESMSPQELATRRMSSEQNLYNFLHTGMYKVKRVERFGLLRYNYATQEMEVV